MPKVKVSLRSDFFIYFTELLNPAGAGLTFNFSSLQTISAILQAKTKISDHAHRKRGFLSSNKMVE